MREVRLTSRPLHGLLAEFADAEALLTAAHGIRRQGYSRVDAYAPFPVEGLAEAVGVGRNRVPLIALLGGILGGLLGYWIQYYSAVVDYPFNIGGRPLHSWPTFIPITFELTVLGATLGAFFGTLALNGLPRLYHPVFNVPEFDTASRHRFFLLVEAADPLFERRERVAQELEGLGAVGIWEVPP